MVTGGGGGYPFVGHVLRFDNRGSPADMMLWHEKIMKKEDMQ